MGDTKISTQIGVRIPFEMRDALVALAKEERRSVGLSCAISSKPAWRARRKRRSRRADPRNRFMAAHSSSRQTVRPAPRKRASQPRGPAVDRLPGNHRPARSSTSVAGRGAGASGRATTIPDFLAGWLEPANLRRRFRLRRSGRKPRVAARPGPRNPPSNDAAGFAQLDPDVGQARAARPQLGQLVVGH